VTRVAYLDCIGGLAGDMLLAALLDAGASRTALDHVPPALGLDEVHVELGQTLRHGIHAATVNVIGPEPPAPPGGTSYPAIRERVSSSSLSGPVKDRSVQTLDRLAEAEARVHGVPVEDVRLHELGAADTLVDVCGAFALLDELGIDRVVCSPLPMSRGFVETAHGRLPSPAPAVLALLHGAPFVPVGELGELLTPTGAAIAAIAVSAWGDPPAFTLDATGYGAGARDLPDRPNVVRVLLGEEAPSSTRTDMPAVADVVLLEANLDDFLPELVPDALERCVAAGAIDVWTAPVQMKKGRPGIVVSALARPGAERAVAAALLEHTSTLGVRVSSLRRYELERRVHAVQVEGHTIRVKVGLLGDRIVNIAPEHDDCAAAAAATGRPVKQIWARALAQAQGIDVLAR
jgi:pyridinium-3,5-bisthiocarboxylic acid mononucleotide nickel chelatase